MVVTQRFEIKYITVLVFEIKGFMLFLRDHK